LQSEGQKTATIAIAEGDAQATRLRNEALTTYFKDSAIIFKQLETVTASLQNKIIVPEGKAISLILNEQENLSKAMILPIPPPPQQKASKQM
jgi:hypothetical protein